MTIPITNKLSQTIFFINQSGPGNFFESVQNSRRQIMIAEAIPSIKSRPSLNRPGRLFLVAVEFTLGNHLARLMDKPPLKIQWEDLRMLSFDALSITILLRGEDNPRTYHFQTREELEEQMNLWFGRKGWHNPDGTLRTVQ